MENFFLSVISFFNKGIAVNSLRFSVILFFSAFVSLGDAKEPEAGFHGRLQLYPFFVSSRSNIDTRNSNQILTSYDQKPETQAHFIAAILGTLSYTFNDRQNQIYLQSTDDNILDSTFYLQVGFKHYFDAETFINLSYLPNMYTKKVWQDPFVLNKKREKTTITPQGFRLETKFNLGLPIQLRYTYVPMSIKDDYAGVFSNSVSGDPLTLEQQQTLKRSGDYHIFDIKPTIPLIASSDANGKQLVLLPRIRYTDGNLDGKAASYQGIDSALGLHYKINSISIYTSLSFGEDDYQSIHPIFNEKRKDKRYGSMLLLSYYRPFNWKNIGVNVSLSYLNIDSNINFYDQSSTQVSAGFWWDF